MKWLQRARAAALRALRSSARSRWIGPAVGIVVLVALVAVLGTEPFLRGLRSLTPLLALLAVLLGSIATAAAAWRWVVVSHRLGVELGWGAACGGYFRSQVLNLILPGGVLGDVGRAVEHGRAVGHRRPAAGIGPASRAVVVERSLGQLTQVLATALILGLVDARYGAGFVPIISGVLGMFLLVLLVLVLLLGIAAVASERIRGWLRRETSGIVAALRSPAAVGQIVVASLLVVACHATMFVIAWQATMFVDAAVAVGTGVPALATAPTVRHVALALVVLLAAALPLSIGGWGPREGAAAWAFALTGYGAEAGVAAATLFGVLALISVVPGAVVAQAATHISRRSHRERTPLRGPELRDLPRRIHRQRAPTAAPPLERGRL